VETEFAPLVEWIRDALHSQGLGMGAAKFWTSLLILVGALVLGLVVQSVARLIIRRHMRVWVGLSKTGFDDLLYERRVFSRLARLAPGITVYLFAPVALESQPSTEAAVQRIALIYLLVVATLAANATLHAIDDYYRIRLQIGLPIKSYVQMASLLLTLGAGILAFAIALNQSPIYFISGLGAMTAVLLLIFKDALLGLVASVQLAANDMVRLGDWIEVPKYGADGMVTDITLTTVKVSNWDNTLSLLPSYALVSDAFRNWRAMSESGGRRIKRSLPIDMGSVCRCTPQLLERFKDFALIADYVLEKEQEIREHNAEMGVGEDHPVNGRQLTNLGVFRVYAERFLQQESRLRHDFTFMVRQLEPGTQGLPVEIYVFTSSTDLMSYEATQADVFDHLCSVVRCFDLRILQMPGGEDLRTLASAIRTRT